MRGVITICEIAVLRLRHIELVVIGVIKIHHVLVGDGDLRRHFAVQQLLDGELPPQVALQVVHVHPARLQLPLELFLGERALQLRKLVLHLAVAGFQVQLLRAFQQDLVVDQLVHHVQLQRKRFFL